MFRDQEISQIAFKVPEKKTFVGLDKAYDSVSRETLWKVLDEYGVKGKLLRAVQALYVDGRARVKVGRMESKLFGVCRGARQGCTLSLYGLLICLWTGRRGRQKAVSE